MPRRLIVPALVALSLVLHRLVAGRAGGTDAEQAGVAPRHRRGAVRGASLRRRAGPPGVAGSWRSTWTSTTPRCRRYYDAGKAVPATLRLARYAKSKGVYVLFNTGRNVKHAQAAPSRQLRRAGFPVDGLCAHYKGESLAQSKQRCRRSFVNNGFTLIANVGNRSTDFVGGNYERAYRLPNYGNRLG